MLSFPSHMPSNARSVPKRTDSLQRTPSTADSAVLTALQDEIHDMRRVQAYGQEEDLKEALGKMIGRVEELSSLLSQNYKSQNELETNLKLARSNLQLALANNEMLEEALKRESASGSKDVGWRRWSENPNPIARGPRVVSEQVTEREKRRSGDSGRSTPVRRESGDQSSMSTPTTETSASTPGSPTPSVAQPPSSPPQENRFFRFRFGSSPSTPSNARLTASASTSRPQTPPPRTRADELRERDAGHLTSVSLPSLVARTDKREEELLVELEAEKEKYTKVVKEKASLEQELEGLSQALFEEANKMVAQERIKCADIEEELRQIRQEKEALKSAMVIIEKENALLKTSVSPSPQFSRSMASNSDLTPRSSRPNSRSGPVSTASPPPQAVPGSPDPFISSSNSSLGNSPPITEGSPSNTSPSSPEAVPLQTSDPTRKDSVPREQAWSPPDRYALTKSPVPDLPVEDSPWAG